MIQIDEIITASNITAGGIGALVAWVISQRKAIIETSKIKSEIINIEFQLNKDINNYYDKYKESSKEILTLIHEIKEADIIGDDKVFLEIWEKIKNLFFIDFLSSFGTLVQTKKIILKFNKDKREIFDFIDEELFPFLESISLILYHLNKLISRKKLKLKTVTISDESLHFVFKFILRSMYFYDFNRKRKLKNVYKSIKKFEKVE